MAVRKKAKTVSAVKKKGVMKSKAKPKSKAMPKKKMAKKPAKKKSAAGKLLSATKSAVKGAYKGKGGISKGKLVSSDEANRASAKRKAQRAEAAGRAGGRKRKEIGKLRQTGSYRDRFGGGHWQGEGPRKPSRMVGTGSRSKVGSHRKKKN